MSRVEIDTQIGLISVQIRIEDDYDAVRDWKGNAVGAPNERQLAELAHAALEGIRRHIERPS